MSVLTIILQGDNKIMLNSKHKSSRDNAWKCESKPTHIVCKSCSASATYVTPTLHWHKRLRFHTRHVLLWCAQLSSLAQSALPFRTSPALFAAKYIYYKQNFLVVKLLECFKLCSLRPCAPQTATVARQANILNLEIISCYVLDILRNYLSLS